MKMMVRLSLLLLLAAVCLMQASTWAGEKKKDPEKTKETVVNGELINADVKDKVRTNSYCKTYTYKMVEGKTYQIDMTSKDVDPYLRLEDPEGKQVAQDDDGGGFPNARIVYKALKGGDYTVVCTTFDANATGKFVLTVKDK